MLLPLQSIAQKNAHTPLEDDLGNVTDVFQENFFEALKQRAIENYELALVALKKAEKGTRKDPENQAVINFEKAKNYVQLRRYDDAEAFYLKTIETVGEKPDLLISLYDLYSLQRNYDKAIELVKKLIIKDSHYKEDLAGLYVRTKQYEKALPILDELDKKWGGSQYRNALRRQIYRASGNKKGEIDKLVAKINSKPKNEQEYLNLIYLYSEQGNTKKAFETAKELQKNYPSSEKVHLALYKFYLTEGSLEKAVASIKVIARSQQIESQNKYRILDDFLAFIATRTQYNKYLEQVVEWFAQQDNNGTFYFQLGKFFLEKDKEKALTYFEKGLKNDSDNYKLIKQTLRLQLDLNQFEKAKNLSDRSLEVFPSQPELYLLNGKANNNLQQWDDAIESLETGLDFLLDNPKIEIQFYNQLIEAYSKKGNTKKAKMYEQKRKALQPEN